MIATSFVVARYLGVGAEATGESIFVQRRRAGSGNWLGKVWQRLCAAARELPGS